MIKISDDFHIHEHGYFISKSSRESFCDLGLLVELVKFFKREGGSVLDLGCGDGRYIAHLAAEHIEVMGYDGNPFTEEITNDRCQIWDLTEVKQLEKSYDWVLCLEVGEHLDKQYEANLISNLHLNNKKGIILSWATPGQGGTAHVNCASNEYIKNIFKNLGYENDLEAENKLRMSATTAYWFSWTIMVFRRKR